MFWKAYEEKRALNLLEEGLTYRQIAIKLNKSYNAVCKKIQNISTIEKREAKKKKEVIGFCDIEASGLDADFAIVYTYCIKILDGKLIQRKIDINDLYKGIYDRNLVQQFIEDCEDIDRVVFHYGVDRKFDIPFLRTRAVKWGLSFPENKCMRVQDTHTILRNKFKLHSNRMEAACTFFDIPSKGHRLNPDIWLRMITGNKVLMQKAINYIVLHNKEDVISLESLWKRIYMYVPLANTSI